MLPVRSHTSEQAPPVHDAAAWLALHAMLQPPQWVGDVLVSTSQPSATSMLQLPRPAAQVIEQAPAAHPAVPPTMLHACAQAPQLAVEVCVLTSQPSVATMLQSAKLALQVK